MQKHLACRYFKLLLPWTAFNLLLFYILSATFKARDASPKHLYHSYTIDKRSPSGPPPSLEEFCTANQEACEDQTHPELTKWIKQRWLQFLHNPAQPLNFERKPVYEGQVGVPVFVDKLLGMC